MGLVDVEWQRGWRMGKPTEGAHGCGARCLARVCAKLGMEGVKLVCTGPGKLEVAQAGLELQGRRLGQRTTEGGKWWSAVWKKRKEEKAKALPASGRNGGESSKERRRFYMMVCSQSMGTRAPLGKAGKGRPTI